jgi:putative transposase
MPRLARAVAVGCAHHVTQRGNNRQKVFLVDDDRRVYLQMLAEEAGKYGLEILGYCLMANHVHLVAIPHAEDSLAKGIGRTHFRYSQYINRFHKRSGHLWQGRFYPCVMSQEHRSQLTAVGCAGFAGVRDLTCVAHGVIQGRV